MSDTVKVRRARVEEAGVLSDIAMRSKAHWGYDDAFIEACREELTVRPALVEGGGIWVAERDGAILGFLDVRVEDGIAEVYACFVEPDAIGSGAGRVIWDKIEELARDAGVSEIGVDSDPYAEGFYQRMGAVRVGEVASGSIPGRVLPRLIKRLG